MNQNTVQQLPEETTKLIRSTQIVTSVGTAVKELIENSIDAGAKVIQVRLENYGLDLIEVKDDGSGVSYDNVQKMFLSGYTSKIRQFEDLDNLHSYGFRGEALAAICKIANVSITTKTNVDSLAMTYEINSSGLPLSSKPSHLNKGTVITLSNLFSNLPVRRLFLSSKKKLSEELKKTEHTVQSLSLIHPELGISLIHNKCPIWRKNSVKGVKQSFMQVAGLRTVSKMEYLNKYSNQINLDLIVPKKKLENTDSVFTNSVHSAYVYVNKRPVNCKILSQTAQEHIFHHYSSSNISFKYAVCLVSVVLPPDQIDINLEPNKSKILLKNQTKLLKLIDETLKNYYGHHDFTSKILTELDTDACDEEPESQSKRPRLEALDQSVGDQKPEEVKDKSQEWDVEIITDEPTVTSNLAVNSSADLFPDKESTSPDQGPCSSQSLCSQINSSNSCLTREEVSEFNSILNETNHKLLVSKNNGNSEARLTERNDIQSRPTEKPILMEWPCRSKAVVHVEQTPAGPEINLNDAGKKSVEEIAEEIEKSAQEWSTNIMKAMEENRDKEENEQDETALNEDVQQFDLSIQSVSSQMGKKEMKAFTKFARIMQPKITQEFPNIKFTQVAGILIDQWKALTSDEMKYYEKMADVVDDCRKIHQEMKQNEKPRPQEKAIKQSVNKTCNLKSVFESMKKKNKISRPPRKEILFPASVDTVRNLRSAPASGPDESDFEIIGKLHPSGNWLYKKGKDIGHIRHQGLQELIVYHKMLASFKVPTKSLEEALLVNEENIGTILWQVLISLESETDSNSGKCIITSDVIVKNGFLIELNKTGEVVSSASIIEVAESIPHFGISELKDLIRMYQTNGDFGGLAYWRPTSVCNYITNEAVRCCGQSNKPPDREELEDLMHTYHLCFRHLPPVCLHSREIFPSIYNLENESSNL